MIQSDAGPMSGASQPALAIERQRFEGKFRQITATIVDQADVGGLSAMGFFSLCAGPWRIW